MLGNISAAYLQLKEFGKAREFGSRCKQADPAYKGAFREAEAYKGMEEWAEAAASYWEALKVDPKNRYCKQMFDHCVATAKARAQALQSAS